MQSVAENNRAYQERKRNQASQMAPGGEGDQSGDAVGEVETAAKPTSGVVRRPSNLPGEDQVKWLEEQLKKRFEIKATILGP